MNDNMNDDIKSTYSNYSKKYTPKKNIYTTGLSENEKYSIVIAGVLKEFVILILITAILILFFTLTKSNDDTNEVNEKKPDSLFELLIKNLVYLPIKIFNNISTHSFQDFFKNYLVYILFFVFYFLSLFLAYLNIQPPKESRRNKIKDWWNYILKESKYRFFIILFVPVIFYSLLSVFIGLSLMIQQKKSEITSIFNNKGWLYFIFVVLFISLYIIILSRILINYSRNENIFPPEEFEYNIFARITLYSFLAMLLGLCLIFLLFTKWSNPEYPRIISLFNEIKKNIFILWFFLLNLSLITYVYYLFDFNYVAAAIVIMSVFYYFIR